jgi:putative aminopeptidase FrvX
MKEIQALLEKLSNAHGVTGREGNIVEIVKEEISPYVDETRVDSMGNLIAVRHGEDPSIMIAAHMDEIGLMTKYVDEKGFVHFIKLGGWFDQTLLNQRAILHTESGPIVGVLGSKPPHVMEPEERKKSVKSEDMFIDIGCKDEKEAESLGIVPGIPVSIDREFAMLAGDRVTGKAFDNRAGVAFMIEALKRTKSESTIYAVGTVQEEVGLKGAKTSAFGLDPDIAIATDVCIPGDHPGIDKKKSNIEVGKGPVIGIADASGRGLIATSNIVNWLQGTAKEFKIDVQFEVSEGGTTDATAIHLTKAGIPTGLINIATRYIHSPVEVLSLDDLDKCADLTARALETAARYFRH